jgi:hypothetical protein
MRRSFVRGSIGILSVVAIVAATLRAAPSSGFVKLSRAEASAVWGGGAGATYKGGGCGGPIIGGCRTIPGLSGTGPGASRAEGYVSCGGACGNAATSVVATE